MIFITLVIDLPKCFKDLKLVLFIMTKGDLKVFIKNNKGTFRRILNKGQYSISQDGKIVLPKDHYSMGYVERIVSDIKWEDFPLFSENESKQLEENESNQL